MLLHTAAWDRLNSLQVLDASFNQLGGALLVGDFPYLPFPATLQQLYLDHNNLLGNVPGDFAGMPHLRCWSFYNNPGLCGVRPPGVLCFDAEGTNIGARLCHEMLRTAAIAGYGGGWEGASCKSLARTHSLFARTPSPC